MVAIREVSDWEMRYQSGRYHHSKLRILYGKCPLPGSALGPLVIWHLPSLAVLMDDMEKYSEIKVVLDIHRDALGSEEKKVKTVFEHNGKKGAQIMILSGCDPDNERDFQNWEKNLSFALKIQNTAEKLYPGMTRPMDFGYFAYNEYICDGSLLIEIGTDANSIDEAEYTGKLLGDVLSRVL